MPFFVPITIGLVATAITSYGSKRGYSGVHAMRRAREIAEEAERRHRRHVALLDAACERLSMNLREAQIEKRKIANTTVSRMVDLVHALERRGRLRTPEALAGFAPQPGQRRTFEAPHVKTETTLMGAIMAVGAAAGASVAATALVSSLTTVSTGAAMSSLSGVAALSATLASLGSGALATGGGSALGAVALGGIAVAPAILAGGWALDAQGEKAVTNAERYSAEVDQAIARIDTLIALLHRAEERTAELLRLLRGIDARASARIEELSTALDTFDDRGEADRRRLAGAMLLCEALSELVRARELDDEGGLDDATAELIARYRHLIEDA